MQHLNTHKTKSKPNVIYVLLDNIFAFKSSYWVIRFQNIRYLFSATQYYPYAYHTRCSVHYFSKAAKDPHGHNWVCQSHTPTSKLVVTMHSSLRIGLMRINGRRVPHKYRCEMIQAHCERYVKWHTHTSWRHPGETIAQMCMPRCVRKWTQEWIRTETQPTRIPQACTSWRHPGLFIAQM